MRLLLSRRRQAPFSLPLVLAVLGWCAPSSAQLVIPLTLDGEDIKFGVHGALETDDGLILLASDRGLLCSEDGADFQAVTDLSLPLYSIVDSTPGVLTGGTQGFFGVETQNRRCDQTKIKIQTLTVQPQNIYPDDVSGGSVIETLDRDTLFWDNQSHNIEDVTVLGSDSQERIWAWHQGQVLRFDGDKIGFETFQQISPDVSSLTMVETGKELFFVAELKDETEVRSDRFAIYEMSGGFALEKVVTESGHLQAVGHAKGELWLSVDGYPLILKPGNSPSQRRLDPPKTGTTDQAGEQGPKNIRFIGESATFNLLVSDGAIWGQRDEGTPFRLISMNLTSFRDIRDIKRLEEGSLILSESGAFRFDESASIKITTNTWRLPLTGSSLVFDHRIRIPDAEYHGGKSRTPSDNNGFEFVIRSSEEALRKLEGSLADNTARVAFIPREDIDYKPSKSLGRIHILIRDSYGNLVTYESRVLVLIDSIFDFIADTIAIVVAILVVSIILLLFFAAKLHARFRSLLYGVLYVALSLLTPKIVRKVLFLLIGGMQAILRSILRAKWTSRCSKAADEINLSGCNLSACKPGDYVLIPSGSASLECIAMLIATKATDCSRFSETIPVVCHLEYLPGSASIDLTSMIESTVVSALVAEYNVLDREFCHDLLTCGQFTFLFYYDPSRSDACAAILGFFKNSGHHNYMILSPADQGPSNSP